MAKKKQRKALKPKIHKLTSTWENQEKCRLVDEWREQNNVSEHDLVPMSLYLDIYSGELMYCLRKHLIPLRQIWHIQCNILARHDLTGEEALVEYELKAHEPMTLWQFLEGVDDSFPDEVFYIDQGHGLKVKWKGHNEILRQYLDSVGDDVYAMITNHTTLTCYTAFNCHDGFLLAQLAKSGNAYAN